MDELLARHRKEQRDLQAQITQKKKSASKKTRKAVNEECTKSEQDLKARQQQEIAGVNGQDDAASTAPADQNNANEQDEEDDLLAAILNGSSRDAGVEQNLENLKISEQDKTRDDQTAQQTRKPNRQKARLARRALEQEAAAAQAAEEASNLPDLKARERARMLEELEKRGLQEKEVAANGHCMYSAVADQMRQLGRTLEPGSVQDLVADDAGEKKDVQRDDYKIVRRAAAGYMSANGDDFAPFLEEPLDDYVVKVKDTGEWGGQLELLALAKSYGLKINVLQGDGRVEKIDGSNEADTNEVWLAYYRHGFGLGEHYNSLRRLTPRTSEG